MPQTFTSPDAIARAIVDRVGKKVVLGLPLGLGKANHIANALVELALRDPSIELHIFTALTLEKPPMASTLERRFLAPAMKRLVGDYPGLLYAEKLRDGSLPKNIHIDEFFLNAGQWRQVPRMQQNYIPVNYSHVVARLIERGINVIGQLVAKDAGGAEAYSLSCNPDLTLDLLAARRAGRADFVIAAQTNTELPYMAGDAVVQAGEIDFMLDDAACDFELFSVPKRPLGLADHAIGLHAAGLIEDGGTLQIGIGSIGDAVTHALVQRHENNAEYKAMTAALGAEGAQDGVFAEGLHGLSEMFVDGFLHLARHGILKREVDGAVFHGSFFVDCRRFYRELRDMTQEQRARFKMKAISYTNTLMHDEAGKRRDRVKARFINDTMMVTLQGAAVSDALDGGAVVSGVGGQHDFVTQAFLLDGARSALAVHATRELGGKTVSNIVWHYPHETIPWHLRDIIITEYGIADLRGRSDAEVIARLLAVTDSRFQDALLARAKKARKIAADYEIPTAHRQNLPETLARRLQPFAARGLLPVFPFGSDFTAEEQRLLPALDILKKASAAPTRLPGLLWRGFTRKPSPDDKAALARLQLDRPQGLQDRVYRLLVAGALSMTAK